MAYTLIILINDNFYSGNYHHLLLYVIYKYERLERV